ncbi:MAG TPA: hypothetical protein VFE46_10785 [Pirellulales bacterium]|jgi:hypothetical protein|nr:hypothetical protein [Pirellulales bacterium]
MAVTVTTLLDIAKANGSDAAVGLIEEVLTFAPEVQMGSARTIKGLGYKTLVRTNLPTAAFRNANEGTALVKSTYENRVVECYRLNPQWEADKSVADAYEDGAQAWIALEAEGIMRGAFIQLSSQFYYGTGTGGDTKGFPGLLAAYDSTNMVVDAAGTTDNVASSVWGVKWGPKDVQWVYGQNGDLTVTDLSVVRVTDSNSNPYSAYRQELLAYPGLQVGNIKGIGRIKKLTTDSGKGLTDSLLSDLYSKFAVGYRPDMWLMNRRSLDQLRNSRTATNPTGAPAPIPTDSLGIPIIVTDGITSTETLAL